MNRYISIVLLMCIAMTNVAYGIEGRKTFINTTGYEADVYILYKKFWGGSDFEELLRVAPNARASITYDSVDGKVTAVGFKNYYDGDSWTSKYWTDKDDINSKEFFYIQYRPKLR